MSGNDSRASATTESSWQFTSDTEMNLAQMSQSSMSTRASPSSRASTVRRTTTDEEALPIDVQIRQQRPPSVEEKLEIVLSLNWAGGKLGAAYYDCSTCQIHVLTDTLDVPPEFLILQKVIRVTNPVTVIASIKQDEQFVKIARETMAEMDRENLPTTGTESTLTGQCSELQLMPSIDFEVGGCRARIMSMTFPGMTKFESSAECAIFMSSLIDFSNITAVKALGALLRYLDRKRINVELEAIGVKTPIACLNVLTLQDTVMINKDTYRALQIFCPEWHPSVYKLASGPKEGLSLYGIFNQCKSTLGSREMRLLLLRPTRNLEVLEQRHLAIQFFTNPTHSDVVISLQNCLKHIKNVSNILAKMTNGLTSVSDWHSLYKTAYNAMLIADTAKLQPQRIEIFRNIATHFTRNLLQLASHIDKMIDFPESFAQRRVVIKFGIDESLDEKKRTYNGLPNFLNLVARQEISRLDSSITECSVIYLPQLGYLLSIPMTDTMRTSKNYNMPDLDFVFVSNDACYYKSACTKELDQLLGDIQNEIFDQETWITMRLQNLVLENSETLLNVTKYAAQLDCLISLAVVAKEFNYVQPKLNLDNVIDIKDGRHPLQELCVNAFVPNSIASGGPHGKVKIITGPNASGKSVYLKQVALIVYMAHIGSFVPAHSATIGLVDAIFTRIQTIESISSGLSTFMIEMNQMSFATRCATKQSLVIVDEFGKGTDTASGMAMLASCVNLWLSQDEDSPHVFVSTHIYSVIRWLRQSEQLKYQMMEVSVNGQEIVHLYRLVEGTASCSFACHVARKARVNERVLDVAVEVIRRISASEPIVQEDSNDWFTDWYQEVADDFLKIEWGSVDTNKDNNKEMENFLKKVIEGNPN